MERPLRIALAWHVYRRGASDIVRGIADYANRVGPWQVLLSQLNDIDVRYLASRRDIDGLILFRDYEGDCWTGISWPKRLPIVSVEYQHSAFTPYQVLPDYYAAGQLVAGEFLRRGYRRLAYYARRDLSSNQLHDAWEREQFAGFSDAVRQAGAILLPAPNVPFAWQRAEHENPPPALKNWFKELPRPVAIMAGTDVRAHHVKLTASAAGLRVPEDIAIIGANNEPWTAIAAGGLSSVEFDDYRAGCLAAEMLHRLIDRETVDPKLVRVPPRGFIARRSSDALAIDDPDIVRALRFIADHSHSPIDVDQVVNASLMSRRSLERRFHAVLNRSIQQEIRMAHLARAKSLLQNNNIPLSRVATLSGFVSLKAMQGCFRRIEKTTPASWRGAAHRAVRSIAEPLFSQLAKSSGLGTS